MGSVGCVWSEPQLWGCVLGHGFSMGCPPGMGPCGTRRALGCVWWSWFNPCVLGGCRVYGGHHPVMGPWGLSDVCGLGLGVHGVHPIAQPQGLSGASSHLSSQLRDSG